MDENLSGRATIPLLRPRMADQVQVLPHFRFPGAHTLTLSLSPSGSFSSASFGGSSSTVVELPLLPGLGAVPSFGKGVPGDCFFSDFVLLPEGRG